MAVITDHRRQKSRNDSYVYLLVVVGGGLLPTISEQLKIMIKINLIYLQVCNKQLYFDDQGRFRWRRYR